MKRSLLVLKDINYASSVSSSTVNTATTPDLLADGALGIYAINPSTNKLALITDGASGTGLLAAGTSVKEVVMFVGTATAGKPIKTGQIEVSNTTVKSVEYVAPVKQVLSFGYSTDSSSGSLNLPSTILKNDEGQIKVIDVISPDENDRTGDSYNGYASVDSAGEYSILKSLFDNLHADNNRKVNMEIYSNGTGTAFVASTHFTGSGTAQIAATNGSKVITVSATSLTAWSSSYGAGTYVFIGGALYKIASVGTPASNAVEITLDREYQGTTFSATNVSTSSGASVASITEHGFRLTDKNFNQVVKVINRGIFADADEETITEATIGNGMDTQLAEYEKITWDRVDRVDRRLPLPTSQVVADETYDQYVFSVANQHTSKNGSGARVASGHEVVIATPEGVADTGGKNQSDLEDILASLGFSVTSLL